MMYFKYWRGKIDVLYNDCGHSACNEPTAQVELPEDWQERLLKIAREMHEGKRGPTNLNQGMINATYKVLDDGRQEGRNEAEKALGVKFGDNAGPDPAVLKMQGNLFRFSGAKSFAQLSEMNAALTKDGEKQDWANFRDDVLKIDAGYNRAHLQSEWQTARQAGHHQRNWQQYQKQKKLFPNLKYKTIGDNRVRDEHAKLNNIVAPIDSDFWRKYYPPNGWRCRCYVVQTAEAASPDIPKEVKEVKPEFRVNVAIEETIFPEEAKGETKPHTFFVLAKSAGGKALERSFEAAKIGAPYTVTYTAKNKATVQVSPFADMKDLEANHGTAKTIADDLALDVKIRPHLDTNILPGTNPEYEIDGAMADRKAIKGYKGVSSGIDAIKKQGATSVVFDLADFKEWVPNEIARSLKGKLARLKTRWVKDVFIVSGNKAERITGDEILDNYYEVLERLKKLKAD